MQIIGQSKNQSVYPIACDWTIEQLIRLGIDILSEKQQLSLSFLKKKKCENNVESLKNKLCPPPSGPPKEEKNCFLIAIIIILLRENVPAAGLA